MTLPELEEEFKRSESARHEAEKRKAGPTKLESIRIGIAEFKDVYADLLEAKAFQRLSKILELIDALSDVEQFGAEIGGLQNMLTEIVSKVQNMDTTLQQMSRKLDDELEKQNKQRQKEQQALDMLTTYLKNWV